MGIITGIFKIIILICLVVAVIFSIYLVGKDIIHIKDIINETESNNGTCDFSWDNGGTLSCKYKENYCIINGTKEFNCKNNG